MSLLDTVIGSIVILYEVIVDKMYFKFHNNL